MALFEARTIHALSPTPHRPVGLCAVGLSQFKASGLAVVSDHDTTCRPCLCMILKIVIRLSGKSSVRSGQVIGRGVTRRSRVQPLQQRASAQAPTGRQKRRVTWREAPGRGTADGRRHGLRHVPVPPGGNGLPTRHRAEHAHACRWQRPAHA